MLDQRAVSFMVAAGDWVAVHERLEDVLNRVDVRDAGDVIMPSYFQ